MQLYLNIRALHVKLQRIMSFQFMEVSKMAESAFRDVVVYGPSALACSHLELKVEQLSSAKAVYEGKDVFVWLPTGFGKSLCNQILLFILTISLV